MRVAVGNDFLVQLYVYDDAELLAAAAGTPTVTVTDPAGTAVSAGSVSSPSTGLYVAKIEARTSVTRLKVVWSYVVDGNDRKDVSYVDVDESYLFGIHELRALPELTDIARYPGTLLSAARDAVTAFFNDYTGSAFVGTFAREIFDGNSTRTKLLVNYVPARQILSLSVDNVAVDFSAFSLSPSGYIRGATTWQTTKTVGRNVVVEYMYGYEITPGDIKKAAILFASSLVLQNENAIPDRARMMTTQWGTFQLSTANEDYPTGIPAVDSVLRRYKNWVPSFA